MNHDESFCGVCGTTLSDLKESGMVGCANCYRCSPTIWKPRCAGRPNRWSIWARCPCAAPRDDTLRHEMMRLERMLRELVAHERFEEAAGVRDRLAELGQRMDGGEA